MLSHRTELIASAIVDSAYKVHKQLGPGLLEKIYEVCLEHELVKAGLNVERQVSVPIIYDGIAFEDALRLDLAVECTVIIEVKAVEIVNAVYAAQLLSYLKLTNKELGFLINFNVPYIKNGIKRFINTRKF